LRLRLVQAFGITDVILAPEYIPNEVTAAG
jgi:hypothetical protein